MKLLWGYRLIHQASTLNLINAGQYGSVPGKNAIELVMLNQISNDICRTQKINIIRFENDASACYDRILVHLGMLAARRCGMPVNAVKLHANTLNQMQYRVKTTFGESDDVYQGSAKSPLFGTGQGSGASPAVWLTLVVVLMNTLERIVPHRLQFTSPDDSYQHSRLIDAFVDDTSIAFTSTTGDNSHSNMVTGLQSAAQTWQQLLSYSGGSLNFKKCSWSIMYWIWHHGRPRLRQPSPDDTTIVLSSDSAQEIAQTEIKYTSPNTAIRMLGVHLCPTGDFTTHLDYLQEKADTFALCLSNSRITPAEMETFLQTTYAPSMLYSLPTMAVNETQLSRVQTKIIATALRGRGCKWIKNPQV